MGCLRSCRAQLAAHSTFLGLQALQDISCSSCFCGYDLLLRVKPLCKHEGLQTRGVLLSRASGHLFQFPMTTLLFGFAAQKNTSSCSNNARQGRGVALEIQAALVCVIKCAKRIMLHYPQFQQLKCSPY